MDNKIIKMKNERYSINLKQILFLMLFLIFSVHQSHLFAEESIKINNWSIEYNKSTKKLDFIFKDFPILKGVYAKVLVNEDTVTSTQYQNMYITTRDISDKLGQGHEYTFHYSDINLPSLKQVFYFYSAEEYFLTEVYMESDIVISSNYMSPVFSDDNNSFLENCDSNRGLSIPFDNDDFVNYLSSPLEGEFTSFEITSIFNGVSRNGVVIGSIEHNTWKTGVKFQGKENQIISMLECYGGINHELTRDISAKEDRPSSKHGRIKGKVLKSPKILFGYFSDWRRGLEIFGEVNSIISPPRKWDKGTPFGWNSWAALAKDVNYESAIEVADFIKEELQPRGFENDNVVYIGLDSYWDNFSKEQLRDFVSYINNNGQIAGIYWCPFSDWFENAEAYVEGTNEEFKYKDIYLYANGRPRKIESLAVDPTHPATKKRIAHFIGMFKELGFKYIKLDFINNGTLEADYFYNSEVTTGIQAYNEGMKYLTEIAGDDMFLALSIAPIFPSQYGTSRRISCDAWGAMTEEPWGSTGYMLNSLSFGWWLDRLYPFNDADHILLYKSQEANDYDEGANRARVTSAVITGIYMLGDNFSLNSKVQDDKKARDKALKFTTNAEINELARMKASFYPVEGYLAQEPNKSENLFMYEDTNYLYLAVFNFSTQPLLETLSLTRLGINQKEVGDVKELWTNSSLAFEKDNFNYSVPPQDVRVYKITKKIN